jgi:hypothetical protein
MRSLPPSPGRPDGAAAPPTTVHEAQLAAPSGLAGRGRVALHRLPRRATLRAPRVESAPVESGEWRRWQQLRKKRQARSCSGNILDAAMFTICNALRVTKYILFYSIYC